MKLITQVTTLIIFSLLGRNAFAQKFHSSRIFEAAKAYEVNLKENSTNDWNSSLISKEPIYPSSNIYREFLQEKKRSIQLKYPKQVARNKVNKKSTEKTLPPVVVKSFQANDRMAPAAVNDNSLAISNDGMLLSAQNRNIHVYDIDTDTEAVHQTSLDRFLNGAFDPKVIYDPVEDKFILVAIAGTTDTTSDLVIAFSQTNDPSEDWNIYTLPGNPKNNDTWSDFPSIAINDKELFITMNLLVNMSAEDPEAWKFSFKESIIWQVDKQLGYRGDSLNYRFFDDILFNDQPIRNLVPVKSGDGIADKDMYFLSNRNFDEVNDTIFLLKLTGDLSTAEASLDISIAKSDIPYGLPPNARQAEGYVLDVNDSRILDCFIENGIIQYVQNTRSNNTNFPAIYHGIISNLESTKNIKGYVIDSKDTLLDFAYPSISYTGVNENDNESIIFFNHSGPTDSGYPGISAVLFESDNFHIDNRSYSDVIQVRKGLTYVDRIMGEYDRWGDYTGCQRKYDEPGKVWVSGYYGYNRSSFQSNYNGTYIAELQSSKVESPTPSEEYVVNISPNPTTNIFQLILNIPEKQSIDAILYDLSGNVVKELLKGASSEGESIFSFSTRLLSGGIYILKITGDKGYSKTERIVINH